MFRISLSCKASELKTIKALDKFGKSFPFRYYVKCNRDGSLGVDFKVKNLSARNEILRRLRHIKNFQLLDIKTEKGRFNELQ